MGVVLEGTWAAGREGGRPGERLGALLHHQVSPPYIPQLTCPFGCPVCCASDQTLKYFWLLAFPHPSISTLGPGKPPTFFLALANGMLLASGRDFQRSPVPREECSVTFTRSEHPRDSEFYPAHPFLPPQQGQEHPQLPSVCPWLQLTDLSLREAATWSQRKITHTHSLQPCFQCQGAAGLLPAASWVWCRAG